ncbi:MAG: CapA family protein [Thermoleophilia bacterium]|nr:CapA family protein [Thermoleophilia bacterium]
MRTLAHILRVGAVVALALFVGTWLADEPPRPPESEPIPLESAPGPEPPPPPKPRAPSRLVTIAATGDILMGTDTILPPNAGRGFFADVQADLAGDVVLGNLEGTFASGGIPKCQRGSEGCYVFRTPPNYAWRLREAGFTVINLANNHAYDYGQPGLDETVAAVRAAGLAPTGLLERFALQRVGDVQVAVVGFAPYVWTNSLRDLPAVRRLVRRAAAKADVVVVTMHAGAEGVANRHVRPENESYLGEERGNVVAFARAAIDAGADLVVGHGPHVLRGMEWYRGRLVAYSLGNFAAYRVFELGGALSEGAILRVTLRADGTFETGTLVATRLVEPGLPVFDPDGAAHQTVRSLSRADFGARAVRLSPGGIISGPPA